MGQSPNSRIMCYRCFIPTAGWGLEKNLKKRVSNMSLPLQKIEYKNGTNTAGSVVSGRRRRDPPCDLMRGLKKGGWQ